MATVAAIAGTIGVQSARADEAPAAVGKNSKIELSGVGWAIYRYQVEDKSKSNELRSWNSFDVDRVYLTGAYAVDERYKWFTTLEASNKAGVLSLFLKKAYLQVKEPFHWSSSTLWFGQFDHQIVGPQEKVWGFRSISRVGLDEFLGVSSAQVGAGLSQSAAGGRFDWALTVGNERPYNRESTHKYKTGVARVTLTPAGSEQGKRFHLMLGAQVNSDAPKAADNLNTLFSVFPYWQSERATAALEVDLANDKSSVVSQGEVKVSTKHSRLIGGFASVAVSPRIRLVGRVEQFDPNTDKKNDAVLNVIGGVARSYGKNVRGILDLNLRNYQVDDDAETEFDSDIIVTARAEVTL